MKVQERLVQYNADDVCGDCGALYGTTCAADCMLAAWMDAATSDTTLVMLTREQVLERGVGDREWGLVAHYFAQDWIAPGRFYPFAAHEGGQLAPLSDAGYEAPRIEGGAHRASEMLIRFAQDPLRRPDGFTELAIVCPLGAWKVSNS